MISFFFDVWFHLGGIQLLRREATLCYVQPVNARTLLATYSHRTTLGQYTGCYIARVFYPMHRDEHRVVNT
jgi:hypothetical protein